MAQIDFNSITETARYHYGRVNITGDHSHSIGPSHVHSISHDHGSSLYGYPVYASGSITQLTENQIIGTRDAFYGTDATWARMVEQMTKQKEEPKMTTLEKVRKERQEALERRKVEAAYAAWDEEGLDQVEDGRVITFDYQGKEHSYTYAALTVGDKWYVTGAQAPNGLSTEDFVAWLIGKDIEPSDLTYLVPS